MVFETFTPALAGSGGLIETLIFTGSLNANGNDQDQRNWIGNTDDFVYSAPRAGRIAAAAFVCEPAVNFPDTSTVTGKVRSNGVAVYTFPVMTGDNTGNQQVQRYVFGEDEALFVAGDLLGMAFDVTNVDPGAYWTAYLLTLIYE